MYTSKGMDVIPMLRNEMSVKNKWDRSYIEIQVQLLRYIAK